MLYGSLALDSSPCNKKAKHLVKEKTFASMFYTKRARQRFHLSPVRALMEDAWRKDSANSSCVKRDE